MNNKPTISASLLAADFAALGDASHAVLAAGAGALHFDVMDHHFVPNLSFGVPVCRSLRKAGVEGLIDVHLMVENPEAYIEPFAKAGANILTFHPETASDVPGMVKAIRAAGMQAGLAFNPDKPVVIADDVWPELSLILLMSVFPGFGGQLFIPEVMDKISHMRAEIDQRDLPIRLGIDGGVKADNFSAVVQAGADFIIMGSGLFGHKPYADTVQACFDSVAE